MSSSRPRTVLLALGGAVLVALAAFLALRIFDSAGQQHAEDQRPNIIYVLVDDQSMHSYRREIMPNVFGRIADQGIQFRQAIAAPPLCCPFRAGFLTGQYPQNHGVSTNKPGYPLLRGKRDVLPAWLRQTDYTTALIGKYLNGYRASAGGPKVAPGWDEWFEVETGTGYTDPQVDVNGELQQFEGSTTDILTDRADAFITEQADSADPFFLWLAHYAPHADPEPGAQDACPPSSAQATPRQLRDYDGPRFDQVRRPSFNEADIADKPSAISERPRLTAAQRRDVALRFRCAAAAMEQVDDGVGDILDTLERTGQLDDTIIVYGSDNGFFFGEHRDSKGKAAIYEEALRVPFAMRVPSRFAGSDFEPGAENQLVDQQDLTATILDWTQADPCRADGECRTLDGRSLIDLLERGDWGEDRAIPYELYPRCPQREEGVRTKRFSYERPGVGPRCNRSSSQAQLYDLRRDPGQLENLAQDPDQAAVLRRLDRTTERLTRCAGIRGRDERTGARPFCS